MDEQPIILISPTQLPMFNIGDEVWTITPVMQKVIRTKIVSIGGGYNSSRCGGNQIWYRLESETNGCDMHHGDPYVTKNMLCQMESLIFHRREELNNYIVNQ